MPKVRTRFKKGNPRHFIREWRKFRGHTQEELAEIVGVTDGAISQLERGETGYTQAMLETLAEALNCQPKDLISRPPDVEWGIDDVISRANPLQKKQILEISKTIVNTKTGTDQ